MANSLDATLVVEGFAGNGRIVEAPAPEAALAVDPADSDEQLMERYRDGDDAAFERLYSRHRGPLYRYFLRQCGGEATAEELFQDVWLKLIKARGRYRVTARFTTYLYQMAHRRLIDHYRRTKVRVALESYGDDAEVAAFPMAAHEQPEQREERRRQTETLLALLATLPAAQREAFLLKAEAGLSLAEIAVVTGTTRETVKSRLRYAVAKLRRGMGALI